MMERHGLWLAITGGGLAWTAHLFSAYFVVALGCPRSWPVGALLAVMTVAAAAVALGGGLVSARRWRRARTHDALEAPALMLAAGALLAGLFTLGIVLGGVGAIILSPCRGVAIGG